QGPDAAASGTRTCGSGTAVRCGVAESARPGGSAVPLGARTTTGIACSSRPDASRHILLVPSFAAVIAFVASPVTATSVTWPAWPTPELPTPGQPAYDTAVSRVAHMVRMPPSPSCLANSRPSPRAPAVAASYAS